MLKRLLKGIWEMFTTLIYTLAVFIVDLISIYEGDEEHLGKRQKRNHYPGPYTPRVSNTVSIIFLILIYISNVDPSLIYGFLFDRKHLQYFIQPKDFI